MYWSNKRSVDPGGTNIQEDDVWSSEEVVQLLRFKKRYSQVEHNAPAT